MSKLQKILLLGVFVAAVVARLSFFSQKGDDFNTTFRAVNDFKSGVNPYLSTIKTFNDKNLGNQGYSYFPVLLYIFTVLSFVGQLFNIPLFIIWKIPILLADILVGVIIAKELRKSNFWLKIFGCLVWFFNPYFLLIQNYTSPDSLAVLFLLLSLVFINKEKSFWGGVFYALSFATKTFALVLFPVTLMKSKNKRGFFLGAFILMLLISVPFLTDLNTYIQGAILVNGERFVQGRPFLFYLGHLTDIQILYSLPFKLYSYLAIFSGWVILTILLFKKKIKNTFYYSFLPFLTFYFFTPVLNKTYLLWVLPFLVIGLYKQLYEKRPALFIFLILLYYAFYSFYLVIWTYNFQYGFRG